MDVYCKNCGEPWDVLSVEEDFTEEEKKMFFSGKGCPACNGIPTMYCENCDIAYKGWKRRNMNKEEIELVWKHGVCPECGGRLKIAKYYDEFIDSLIECDGAIEEVLGKSVIELL